MHLGGKCQILWSNDDLERFLKSGHFVPSSHESIRSQAAMADKVKGLTHPFDQDPSREGSPLKK